MRATKVFNWLSICSQFYYHAKPKSVNLSCKSGCYIQIKKVTWRRCWSLSIMNLEPLIFTWKGQHIVLTLFVNTMLWVPNFRAVGIYFIFRTKFSWNEGIDTCFNIECLLLSCNFDFLGGYWRLLLVTAQYCSFPCNLVWLFKNCLEKCLL